MVWALSDPALNTYVGSGGTVGQPWPGLQQLVRIERQRTFRRRGQASKVEREVSFAITSLPASRADAPLLAVALRGHWGIENRAHWVRDVVFDEDRSQVRSGAAPQVLAAGRNLAITLLRRAGYPCIAAALRTLAGRPACAVQLVLSPGGI
jgi:predicted transposase YbfD/YdcC